jgi:hypothetical protein
MALWGAAWSQERPIEWLQRAVRAEGTLVVRGERTTEIRRGARTERIVERFWRQGGQAIRIEVVEPAARRGEVLLFKDDQWLRYRPDEKEAVRMPAPLHGHERLLYRLLNAVKEQQMRVEMHAPEMVLERPCVVIQFQMAPRPEPPPAFEGRRGRHEPPPAPLFEERRGRPEPIQSITLWIDRATGLVMRREVRFHNSDALVRIELTRVEFPRQLPSALFQLPEGVTVRPSAEGRFESIEEAQQAAGFAIRLPTYLPEGSQREGIIVRRMRERVLVAIRYRSPQGDFTLFQTLAPKADFRLPEPPKRRPLNAHFWQAGDYWFGLVGTLPREEMERIARSMPKP